MAINFQISRLLVPELEFAGSGYFTEPRRGLVEAGPFDMRYGSAHRSQVRLALVGTPDIVAKAVRWFDRCQTPILLKNHQGIDSGFPGFSKIFRSELIADSQHSIKLKEADINIALSLKPFDGFKRVVRLYSDAIHSAKREFQPDVVICCIPELVEKRFWSVRKILTKDERLAIKNIAEQQESKQLDLPLDWEVEESQEDLLTRDLRRALKAEAMRLEVPIQLARENLFLDSNSNEDPAIRAWNSSVGLYYKAGGIPWRIRNRGPETCYVGITFHHLRTNKRALVYSAIAQAFSSKGEGFALKGSALEPDPGRRSVHMTKDQAMDLGIKVLSQYIERNGNLPKRVVLHKSSRFWEDEQEGFYEAFKNIPLVQLIALAPSSLRLVTHAAYPPSRGTLLTVEGSRNFLFTSGYIHELGTYPGPHIPVPIELIIHGEYSYSSVREAAQEILALGRLNWNTSDLRSSQPVTLGFARRVGGIMAEYGLFEDRDPDPSYRYYM